MRARDFCYWVQGYFELTKPNLDGSVSLTDEQVKVIRNHLAMVFKHEIDPSNGTPEHNNELSKLHLSGLSDLGSVLNC